MKKQKAFTLIELLIVIAIIGILASVVLVMISSAKDKAKEKVYISYVVQITKLVKGAISSGEFTDLPTIYPGNLVQVGGCLGKYSSNLCNTSSIGLILNNDNAVINNKISNIGNIPNPGVTSPYNVDSGVAWYYYGNNPNNIYIIVDIGDNAKLGMCNDAFGWENYAFFADFCWTTFPI